MNRLFVAIVAMLLVSGCATPIAFDTVSLGNEPTATSNREASIVHISGAVRGANSSSLMPLGNNVFVPISTGPVPHLQFHAEDQAEFIKVLRKELLRLKVFKAVSIGADQIPDNIKISVIFAQTYHQIHHQEYTLDVAMSIEGGKKAFLKQYRVNSNEKATTWERWNTNAYEGKVLAVRRLLERLTPDIQAYVAENL
jgi:hypothetical protein